jgi:hypothetical protein
MDYISAGDLTLIGGAQNIHRYEGRHEPAPGRTQTHDRTLPPGVKMQYGLSSGMINPSLPYQQSGIVREEVAIGERLSL